MVGMMGRKQSKRAAFARQQKRARQIAKGAYMSRAEALRIAARRTAEFIDQRLYESIKAGHAGR
jgi:hypothetical protein